ncbi:hypothetical protein AS034_00935 [[Bacillus] enclensis]|uniref:XRE family transcriptional regulator n=1 Tax=[Bacillus] enclensis TaxID=1402860 RepID=A0A0V8HPC7_9BACI|nr:hypothetical protein [[Bacillus] enclensis]KSU64437.1 hypothetical protein AS034_00935 [[Bacillus] enclensis]SCB74085.1 hypothetical protein GA0061094_0193 [[Bacillus] enclensis]
MLKEEWLIELEEYLSLHLQDSIDYYCLEAPMDICKEEIVTSELDDFIEINRKPPFNQVLFQYIDEKGVGDSVIYKKAGLDRRHFSKIRSNPAYQPKKATLISLALALELNSDDTEDLLSAAGYSLSDSDKFDLIIQFCLEKEIYDLQSVNEILHHYGIKPLNV